MKSQSPWIQLTNRCDMACGFCYVCHDGRDMPARTFAAIVDGYLGRVVRGELDRVDFRLAGGEPGLVLCRHLDIIKRACRASEPQQVHFEIITNGHALYPPVLSLVRHHPDRVGFCVSLDSTDDCSEGHKNAVGLMKRIDWIAKHCPTVQLSLSTVVIQNGKWLPLLAEYVSSRAIPFWDIQTNTFGSRGYDASVLGANIDEMVNVLRVGSHPIKRVQFNGIRFVPRESCGAGDRLVAFDVDGKKYPCQTLLGQKRWKRYDRTKCDSCPIVRYCGCGCSFHNQTDRKATCHINRHYFEVGAKYGLSLCL